MKYNEHPNNYSWNNMPDAFGTTATANLIKDIFDYTPTGFKSYDCNGTGVDQDYNIAGLFTNGFNYSHASNSGYDRDKVKTDLNSQLPILMTGGRDDGWWIFHDYTDGHAWVCDGYRDVDICTGDGRRMGYLYFRMNWGWGGNWNGWYGYNDFSPAGFTFNYDVRMVNNINP